MNHSHVDIVGMIGQVPLCGGVKFYATITNEVLNNNLATTNPDMFFKKTDGSGYKVGLAKQRREEFDNAKGKWWREGTLPTTKRKEKKNTLFLLLFIFSI